jgi:hypothetical protein
MALAQPRRTDQDTNNQVCSQGGFMASGIHIRRRAFLGGDLAIGRQPAVARKYRYP